jgi:hypothetical protein
VQDVTKRPTLLAELHGVGAADSRQAGKLGMRMALLKVIVGQHVQTADRRATACIHGHRIVVIPVRIPMVRAAARASVASTFRDRKGISGFESGAPLIVLRVTFPVTLRRAFGRAGRFRNRSR